LKILQLDINLVSGHYTSPNNVSMLEPHTPSTIPNRTEPPPAPVEVEGDLKYEIAEILNTKIDKR